MYSYHIQVLIEKYFAGTITPDERVILDNWYKNEAGKNTQWVFEGTDNEDRLRLRMLYNIKTRKHTGSYRIRRRPAYAAVAAAIITIAFGVAYFRDAAKPKNQPVAVTVNYKNDILPGGNKAILTLANGSHITLNNSGAGVIAKQGSAVICKEHGKLVYDASTAAADKTTVNVLATPVGGQYQLVLADGTKVWLNAESSIKYPSQFLGKTREVELTGEAYFEVAKNAQRPFHVQAGDANITVLGTHFNVKAYQDENRSTTTLLEGLVKVTKGRENKYITPGQQAITDDNTPIIDVKNANVVEVIAWQKGYYVFKNRSMKSIMQEIRRWYDIEVAYVGDVDELTFSGRISRFNNISEILKLLELTGDIHFKIDGRRVTVMP